MDYSQAQQIFEKSRKRKLANNTYLEKNSDGCYAIKLHSTQIIRFYPEKTVLFSGGYRTVTTKARLNEFTDFHLCQKNGVWYIGISSMHFTDYKVFADGLEFNTKTREWYNVGENPKKISKLHKQVKQYAKDFVTALFAGKVPKPSAGDCWYCGMTTVKSDEHGSFTLGDAVGDANHFISHMKEKYYVPSLCVNACKMFPVSKVTWWSLQELWENGETSDYFAGVAKRQIESVIRRYCYRQLQTA